MDRNAAAGPGRLVLFIGALMMAAPAAAADDSQLWVGGSVTAKLSNKWRASEELTTRFSDDRRGLYEIESNTLLGYSIGPGVALWAGYTHNPQYSEGDFTIMEHRAREQVTFDNFATLGQGKFNGRVRMEQRWREGVDGRGWRVRPWLKYSLPVHKGSKTALVLSTEFFFNVNRTEFQRTRGLDRVRSLVGISTPLAKNIMLEAGYLNQHTFVRRGPDNDDHVASIAMSLSL